MGRKITDPALIAKLNAQVRNLSVPEQPSAPIDLSSIGIQPTTVPGFEMPIVPVDVNAATFAPQPINTAEGIARSILQGGTFGFGDEVAAGIGTGLAKLTGSPEPAREIFQQMVGQERGRVQQFEQEQPAVAIGSEIAGAIPTGLLAGLGIKKAAPELVEQVAARTPGFAKLVTAGAGGGAVFGAGKAETGKTVEGAGKGAFAGAIAGPAFHLLINKIGIPATGFLIKKINSAPRSQATRLVKQAMIDSGFTRKEAEAELKRLGPDAILADLGGQLRNLARTASAQPTGTARKRAEDFLTKRDLAQQAQLWRTTADLTGSEGATVATLKKLDLAQKRAAGPLYKEAYAQPITQTQTLRNLLELTDVKSALKLGLRMVEAETGKKVKAKALIGGKFVKFPDMKQWDYIQRGLRRKASTLQRSGDRDQARAIFQLRERLVNELDQVNPAFARARATYATSALTKDALEQGQKFLKEDAELLSDYLSTLTASERQAFTIGATKAIKNEILRPGETRDLTRIPLFSSPLIRERLTLALGPDRAGRLLDQAQNLAQMRVTKNALLNRSPTADILAGGQSAKAGSLVTGAAQAAAGDTLGGIRQAATALRPSGTLRPDVAAQLTDLLLTPNPALRTLTGRPSSVRGTLGPLVPFIGGGQAAGQ